MVDKTSTARRGTKKVDKEARALDRAAVLMGKDPKLAKTAALRKAGIGTPADVRRLAARLTPPQPQRTPAARARKAAAPVAAAPLLASTSKKIGTLRKDAGKPSKQASHQPKIDIPPVGNDAIPVGAPPASTPAVAPDIFALARPWMKFGLHLTMTGIAVQASVTRAALTLPPVSIAMRQGANALNSMLALAPRPRTTKD